MLIYANSLQLLNLGQNITIEENSILYTEYTDADIYAELESTQKKYYYLSYYN